MTHDVERLQPGSERSSPPNNVVSRILRCCSDFHDRIAVESEAEQIRYGTLEKLVRGYAAHLAVRGVSAGDVVALRFDDETELTLSMLAALYLGATILVIPRSTAPDLCREWLERSRCRLLMSDSPGQVTHTLPLLYVRRDRIDPGASLNVATVQRPSAPALIIVGSGSTGSPRLLPVSHTQLRFRIDIQNEGFGLREDRPDRLFMTSHIEYPSAGIRALGALCVGASLLFPDKSTVGHLQEAITRRSVTVVLGTVLHIENLLGELPESGTPAWGHLRVLGLTSSTVTDELRARIRHRLTEQLYVVYGTNESMSLTIADPTMTFRTPGTVGRPSRGVQIELVDADGQPVPRGSVGRIRTKSPGQIDGYLDDPEQNRLFFQDGWFVPGDLGMLTEQGELVFYGRSDDLLIFNGVNIYPAEIERCLASHPAVRDVAVVACHHQVHQDLPLAAVALHSGSQVTPKDLHRHAVARLGFRCPKVILLLQQIPRTSHGKVDRAALRRLVESLPELAAALEK